MTVSFDPQYFDVRQISSLEKVFPVNKPLELAEVHELGLLKNESISYQLAYRYTRPYHMSQMEATVQLPKNPLVKVEVLSPISDLVNVRQVKCVPSMYPAYAETDDHYLTTEAGLFPDVLEPFDGMLQFIPYQWRSLWIEVTVPKAAKAGKYPVIIQFTATEGIVVNRQRMTIHIMEGVLPEQQLLHTEWLHGDCLADYYGVEVFGEEHWRILGNFIQTAAKRGINVLLTPLFTPPLDTFIGNERTTIQLVDVSYDVNGYRFGFDKLDKWVQISEAVGITHFEMAHLFSQWGAKYAPKIIVEVGGVPEQRFGWHTPANDPEFRSFLAAFLPALTERLHQLGIAERSLFHISDEPVAGNLHTYLEAKQFVAPYLEGFPIIDAISDVEFYRRGIIDQPVAGSDTIHNFIDEGASNLWVYYCCGQNLHVSNRFLAMPSSRNRILGVQMYKYRIKGFLHWGFNFYNSQYSLKKLNPYVDTAALDTFPSGDSFLVYPSEDGTALESLRLVVLQDALTDLRALQYLESLSSREFVLSLIEEDLQQELTFSCYPRSADYLLHLRNKINKQIEQRLREN
ncbi:DUF4091 domain-containing protein [Paenibacillus sp. Aloe-11]|uniref:DUF4091 domain-containing protein n=1 Tax=Paenibacillus sp. Aloe-11 TaxID=1050222 RepID=UPI00024F0518|nr:DUF4091 domain-containing protein [Paenibacillus sp. Aloe-11]EHS57587.1 hypothetical protein WG8_2543 [Paenibacillus sp. Aloe-11]